MTAAAEASNPLRAVHLERLIRPPKGRVLSQVNQHMNPDVGNEPTVKSSRTLQPRPGRGFSLGEINEAGLALKTARAMGLIVDMRRETSHEDNIEALKQYMKAAGERALARPAGPAPLVDTDAVITELTSIRAVKKADAAKLVDAGIRSLSDLAYCEIGKVSKKTGIEKERLTAIVRAALKKV